MNKPTQEQTKEFWGWCGFDKDTIGNITYPGSTKSLPIYGGADYPPLDLNSLFKYAPVPSMSVGKDVDEDGKVYFIGVANSDGLTNYYGEDDKDPALALFWALRQAKEVSNGEH